VVPSESNVVWVAGVVAEPKENPDDLQRFITLFDYICIQQL